MNTAPGFFPAATCFLVAQQQQQQQQLFAPLLPSVVHPTPCTPARLPPQQIPPMTTTLLRHPSVLPQPQRVVAPAQPPLPLVLPKSPQGQATLKHGMPSKWCKRLRTCKCPYLQQSGACRFLHLDDLAAKVLGQQGGDKMLYPTRGLLRKDASTMQYFLLKDVKKALQVGFCTPQECRSLLVQYGWDLKSLAEVTRTRKLDHNPETAQLLADTLIVPAISTVLEALQASPEAPARYFATYMAIERLVAPFSKIREVSEVDEDEESDEEENLPPLDDGSSCSDQ